MCEGDTEMAIRRLKHMIKCPQEIKSRRRENIYIIEKRKKVELRRGKKYIAIWHQKALMFHFKHIASANKTEKYRARKKALTSSFIIKRRRPKKATEVARQKRKQKTGGQFQRENELLFCCLSEGNTPKNIRWRSVLGC